FSAVTSHSFPHGVVYGPCVLKGWTWSVGRGVNGPKRCYRRERYSTVPNPRSAAVTFRVGTRGIRASGHLGGSRPVHRIGREAGGTFRYPIEISGAGPVVGARSLGVVLSRSRAHTGVGRWS